MRNGREDLICGSPGFGRGAGETARKRKADVMRTMRAAVLGVMGAMAGMGVLPSPVAAVETSGSAGVDVVSAYIFRGATVNDEVNVNPYLEVTVGDVVFGTWGNFNTDPEQFDEIDYYVSYDIPLPEDMEVPLSLGVGYTEYTYHGVEEIEADREVNLTLGLDTLFAPSLFVAYGIEGPFLEDGLYIELSGGYDYEVEDSGVTLSAGAALGYEAGDNFEENGFSHLTLSVGGSYGVGSLSLNYVVETDKDVVAVDEDFYVALGVSI
jgi:hypothetical protein